MRDACVEADAGDVEEQTAVQFSAVDHPFGTGHRHTEGLFRCEWDAKLAREPVA